MIPQLTTVQKLFDCNRRSPVITVWLWLCVIANFANLIDLFIGSRWQVLPQWLSLSIAVVAVAVIIGYVILLSWERSGFYLLCGCAVANAVITGITSGIVSIIPPLVSIVILFAILQIRKHGISYWNAMRH